MIFGSSGNNKIVLLPYGRNRAGFNECFEEDLKPVHGSTVHTFQELMKYECAYEFLQALMATASL